MKIIITENQHRLLRRVSEIGHLIGPMMDLVYEYMKNSNPSALNMFHYDTFIDFTTLKITKKIVNRTNFNVDDKIELETQIQRFIETEYIDVIREYFYSRMIKDRNINESYDKRILTENQHKFIRRYQEIEDGIWDFILTHKLNVMDTFDGFLTEICWNVAQDVVSKMNIPEEDYVTYRNQLIRFIKNNFYEELKEFWDRNHYWDNSKNINESYDKIIFKRRHQQISEFIDRALSRFFDVCLYMDVIDFVDRVMDYTADNLYDSLFNYNWDDQDKFYQPMYDFISDHFADRIHEFYEDNKHFCIDEDGNWIN